jgi:hypothetical protein
MLEGNKKIFEKIWKLVLKVNRFLEENTEFKNTDSKTMKDITNIRNSQISMVLIALKKYLILNINYFFLID